jgi:hypothetical protein
MRSTGLGAATINASPAAVTTFENHLGEDRSVPPKQLQPGFARALRHPAR